MGSITHLAPTSVAKACTHQFAPLRSAPVWSSRSVGDRSVARSLDRWVLRAAARSRLARLDCSDALALEVVQETEEEERQEADHNIDVASFGLIWREELLTVFQLQQTIVEHPKPRIQGIRLEVFHRPLGHLVA